MDRERKDLCSECLAAAEVGAAGTQRAVRAPERTLRAQSNIRNFHETSSWAQEKPPKYLYICAWPHLAQNWHGPMRHPGLPQPPTPIADGS